MSEKNTKTCGLVMPISAIDGCSAEHWTEVKTIITDAIESIEDIDFTVKLVSDADDVGVIQKRIVQNLYKSDIVVCDVSGKNPNVMFELGLRLAFDKPTIIVKDDKTDYSFDTGVIEHVSYRRDLRFSSIVSFKKQLSEKLIATLTEAEKNPDHSTFLKNFGTFHVATLKENEVSSDKIVIEMLSDLQTEVAMLRRRVNRTPPRGSIVEGRARIKHVLHNWISENNCSDMTEIIGNEDFYNYVEKEIDARVYFPHRSEFIEILENEIEKIAA